MKNILMCTCILLTFNVYAAGPTQDQKFADVFSYKFPTERENGTLIKNDEIAFVTIYEYDCITDEEIRVIQTMEKIIPGKSVIKHYMFSDKSVMCIRMIVTDVIGSKSKLSELMKGYDFRTPKPTECLP